ncbi:MAG: SsrA-binding protein, partial [Patescibacteria group bacterium]|nr:SsrA-binding protein [Patescibacteria group bacterium]
MEVLAENKKAYFNYQILERFEAGISLIGQEVKSLKKRGVNLAGSYVVIKDEEAFWIGANIPPYQPKNAPPDYNPERS